MPLVTMDVSPPDIGPPDVDTVEAGPSPRIGGRTGVSSSNRLERSSSGAFCAEATGTEGSMIDAGADGGGGDAWANAG